MTTTTNVELIPRDILFGNPVKTSPQVSPDGKQMAYLAPVNNVLNVWVGTIGSEDYQPVTRDERSLVAPRVPEPAYGRSGRGPCRCGDRRCDPKCLACRTCAAVGVPPHSGRPRRPRTAPAEGL